jgi:succinate dehydrogenase flavin-adding protein (antitoxin of CptAB toxin-antitoxin module)
MRDMREPTRARDIEGERVLRELDRLLVERLAEHLDLTDPDDLEVYNKTLALRDHIKETLKNAEKAKDTQAERDPIRQP